MMHELIDDVLPKIETTDFLLNHIFFGYKVTIGGQPADKMFPARLVRDAVKYVSLEEKYQKIWDDPTMLTAHKYQNIPQIDISTYQMDYEEYPILTQEDGSISVTYVYSANKERHTIILQPGTPVYDRFLTMSRFDKLQEYYAGLPEPKSVKILPCLMAFSEHDMTDMLVDGMPQYDVTIQQLYDAWKSCPQNTYVPFRRGWSRVLNIRVWSCPDTWENPYVMFHNGKQVARMISSSSVTHWDGKSMRVENHGVEAEDMDVTLLHDLDKIRLKVRRLEETHEYMRDVTICRVPRKADETFYAIYTIKGININGFEFNMP